MGQKHFPKVHIGKQKHQAAYSLHLLACIVGAPQQKMVVNALFNECDFSYFTTYH